MSDDLLPYYHNELDWFRRMAPEFALKYPKIAGRLRLGTETCEDPHVERMIEAFSFLNARIRHKLDDDFPEISDAFLEVLYPHYLRPIPSMSIVQFGLAPGKGSGSKGYTLPAETSLDTDPIDGEPCRFRTCYPVTLWPFQMEVASLNARPTPAPASPRGPEAVSILRLKLKLTALDLPIGKLELTQLRFFLQGLPHHTLSLYELLFNNVLEIAIARSAQDPQPIILGRDAIRPVGFGSEEGMLPYSARSAVGFRLLSEFFVFPQKFQFFELTGLDPAQLSEYSDTLEIYFYLNRSSGDLERNVSAETFQMGCSPVVNLFRQRAEPIQLTNTVHEYRLVPDVRRPQAMEVYSIDRVVATSPDGEKCEYLPFYAMRRGTKLEKLHGFWHATRRSGGAPTDPTDQGTELFLSLVDLNREPAVLGGWTLDVQTTCLNRDLPSRLPFGGGQPSLQLSQGSGIVTRLLCLTAPTRTLRPPRRHKAQWRLISHLALGHLPIVDGESGADEFREMLHLYDFKESNETRQAIEGLVSIETRRGTARIPGTVANGFCRGMEVDVEFDPRLLSGNESYLFASVIEAFLGQYVTINSYSRLSLKYKGREGAVKRWPPRAGERILL